MATSLPDGTTRDLLYSAEERRRRDASPWTLVQGILAPLQFLVFLVSAVLVWRCLATGEGAFVAHASVFAKTFILYSIMVTGSLWERDVFGRYLFAGPFFWEDVVSMGVIALHTLYVAAVAFGWFDLRVQLLIALAAYAAYVINGAEFLFKFRLARKTATVAETALAQGAAQ